MRIGTPSLRRMGRAAGIVLVVLGAIVAGCWFYFLAPARHIKDSEWCKMHSRFAFWAEAEKHHKRTGAGICECCTSYIGWYGGKEWMEWAIEHLRKDKDFFACACSGEVLADIANQMPADGWIDWWERNNTKTQEEWLKDGFARYAVAVHVPPAESEIEPLLSLLGNSNTNESERIPGYIRYNAYRWLRDSGFKPVGYAVSNLSESTSEVVKKGLVRYSQFELLCPKQDQVGILAFGKTCEASESPPPFMSTSKIKYSVYAVICLLPTVGGFLIWRLLRRKR